MPIFSASDVYIPVGQWDDPTFRDRRVGIGLFAIGRLKSGATATQALADMESVTQNLAAAYPDADKGTGVTMIPLKTDVVGSVRGILLVLLGAVTFVLLIACANVANLLLARATGRAREFAIRSALGAGPARVIRQLLTESILLGIAGGAIGLLLALWGTRAILVALPDVLPRASEIDMNWHVLLFTAAISILTGIFFGLVPALKARRTDMHETLKEGGRGSSGAVTERIASFRRGSGHGAGAVGRRWADDSQPGRLAKIDPGFDARNVLSFETSITSDKNATAAQLRAKYRESVRQLEACPAWNRPH